MFWQLNDVWAAPTWAAVDVSLRPKMLYYAVRDAYLPLVVSSLWNGSHVEVYVVNELFYETECGVDIFLHDTSWMKSLNEWSVSGVQCSARSASLLISISATEISSIAQCSHHTECFLSIEFVAKFEHISTKITAPFGYNWRDIRLYDPEINIDEAWRTDNEVVYKITALRPAMWVWLEAIENGLFSYNAFTMLQHEKIVIFTPNSSPTPKIGMVFQKLDS